VHQGSYDRLPAAYGALAAWTQVSGYRAAGPNREVYLQGFEAGDSAAGYITELQLPVQPVSVQRTIELKEGQAMEPRIVTKPAFTVVGLPFTGFITNAPLEAGNENNEIGKVWDEFNARMAEVKHVSGPAYGLCFGMPNDKEPWYIAGVEVARAEDVPAGMMSMTVPAQMYAVFPCTLGTLGATYRMITEQWQPRSGYEHADAPDFELYDQEFDPENPQQGRLSVYWPIR
jgi:AraC family transcriptional regulator